MNKRLELLRKLVESTKPTDLTLTLIGTIDAYRESRADVSPNEIYEALDDVRETVKKLEHIRST